MAKKKAKKEIWEVDIDKVTLDDLVLLEEGPEGLTKASEVRELLGRIIKNRTEGEIGKLPLTELWKHIDMVAEAIDKIVPKASDTPS